MRVLLAAAVLLAVLMGHGAVAEDVATSVTPSAVISGTTGVQLSLEGVLPNEGTMVAFAGVSSNCDISGGDWVAQPAHTFAGGSPFPVVMEDVTEDGLPDLVFIDGTWSGVLVNNGGGKWTSVTSNAVSPNLDSVTSTGPYAAAMALADMDLNGRVDVLFGADVFGGSNANFAAFWVPTLGNGVTPNTAQRLTDSAESALGEMTFMTAGDLNGDGLPDVVTLHDGAASAVHVLFTTNPFETQHGATLRVVTLAGLVGACTIADLHSSGEWHIVCASSSGVFRINSDLESFALTDSGASHLGSGTARSIVVEDIDLDGKKEIVFISSESFATVLYNANPGADNGWTAVNPTSTNTCTRVAVGDVHMDGRLDVVCASASSGIVVSDTPEDITVPWPAPAQPVATLISAPTLLEVRDVDGDLDLDITVVVGGEVHVLANAHLFSPVPYTSAPVSWTPPVSLLSGVLDVCVSEDSGTSYQHQSSVRLRVSGLLELVERVELRGHIVPGETATLDVPDTLDGVSLYVQPAWGVDVCNVNNFAGGRAMADFTTTRKIVAGDVDGDGRTDVLACDQFDTDTLYVAAGRVPGTVAGQEELLTPFEKISLSISNPADFGVARVTDAPHDDIFVLTSGLVTRYFAVRDTHADSFFGSETVGSGDAVNDHLAFGDIRGTGLDSVVTCRTTAGPSLAGVKFWFYEGGTWTGRDVTTAGGCVALATGNMDNAFGDDVVVAYSSGEIKVYATQDDGISFPNPQTVSGADTVDWAGMVTADMDKDGLLDVVAWDSTNGLVHVFFQTSGGSYDFVDVLPSGAIGAIESSVEAMDTNGDGWLDVAVVRTSTAEINLLINPTDSGTIKSANWARVAVSGGDMPPAFALGSADATHNGMRDLLLAANGGSAESRFLLAFNSRFQVSAESTATSGVVTLAMLDASLWVDGSLKDVELMVCARPTESSIAFPQRGVRLPIVEKGASVASKFEPDQVRLLSTVNVVTDLDPADGMEVGFVGKGRACFDERFGVAREVVPQGSFSRISKLLSADMNKDGLPDLIAIEKVASSGRVGIAFRNALGTYWLSAYTTGGTEVTSGQVADVDRDGYPDLLLSGSSSVDVFANSIRDCSFGCAVDTARTFTVGTASVGVAADINRDGILDFLTVDGSNRLNYLPSTGRPYVDGSTFGSTAELYTFPGTVLALDVYDQEHNGNLRVYALTDTAVVELKRSDTADTDPWTRPTSVDLLAGTFVGGVFGDVNVDGNVDVVYVSSSNTVEWKGRTNSGSTSFDDGGQIMGPSACTTGTACTIAMGDIDADGVWDIFIADEVGSKVHHCVFGDSASCKNVIPPALSVVPTAVALFDADGDSDIDVVIATSGGVMWLENTGVMNRFTYDSPSTSVSIGIITDAQPANDERPVLERPLDVCVRPSTGGMWQRAPSLGVSVATYDAGIVHEFAPLAVPEGAAIVMDVVAPYHLPGNNQVLGVVGEMDVCQFYQNGNLFPVTTGAWAFNSGTCSPQPFGCFSGGLRPILEQFTTVSIFDKELFVALSADGNVYLSYTHGEDTFLPSWETTHKGASISGTPDLFSSATADNSAILVTGDLDGDFLDDIVVVGTETGNVVSWLRNPGAGALVDEWAENMSAHSLTTSPCSFAFTADFDFDDKAEVVCVGVDSVEVAWGFDGTTGSLHQFVNTVTDAFAADVDNSGDLDIVLATTTNLVWWAVTDKTTGGGYTEHVISTSSNGMTHLAFLAPGLGFVASSDASSSIDVLKEGASPESEFTRHPAALTVTGVAGVECRTAWVRANGLPQLLCMDPTGAVHELHFTGDVSNTWDQGRRTDAGCAANSPLKVADLDDDGDDEFYCLASNTQSLVVTDNQVVKAVSPYSGDPLTFSNMRRKDGARLPITTKLCYTDGAHPPTEQVMVSGVTIVEDYELVTDVSVASEGDGAFLTDTATELSFKPLSYSPQAQVAFTPVNSADCGSAGTRVGKAGYASEPYSTTITAAGEYYVCVTQDNGATWFQQSATVTVTESGGGGDAGSDDGGDSDGGDTNTGGAVGSGDPHFEGIWGGWFDFTGEAGKVYNLVSDTHVQMNARFMHLDGRAGNMPGTYMSEVGLQLGGTHRILFRANGRVSIHPLHPHGSWRGRFDLGPGGFALADGTSLDVYYDVYHIRLNKHLPPGTSAGADAVNGTHVGYRLWVNEAKLRRLGRWDTYLPHGVQGQTGRMFAVVAGTDKYGGGVVEGTWREYALPSDDIFGNDFVFNQFTQTDGASFGRGAGDDSGVESEAEAVEEMDNLQQSAQAVGGEGV